MATASPVVKVADEVWLATAMLHQRNPERTDFSVEEIMEFARKAKELRILGPLRPGFYVHVIQHCVANRPPNPARYRMLIETASGRRRLYRPGDSYHPQRDGARTIPRFEDLPGSWFKGLLNWHKEWCSTFSNRTQDEDPILALVGSGKKLWQGEDPDEYVRRLREGWE